MEVETEAYSSDPEMSPWTIGHHSYKITAHLKLNCLKLLAADMLSTSRHMGESALSTGG